MINERVSLLLCELKHTMQEKSQVPSHRFSYELEKTPLSLPNGEMEI